VKVHVVSSINFIDAPKSSSPDVLKFGFRVLVGVDFFYLRI